MNREEELKIFRNKLPNKIYISRAFTDNFDSFTGDEPRLKRFISGVVDSESMKEFAMVNKEITIRVTPKCRQEIKAIVFQDNREVQEVILQRFNRKNGTPTINSFHFSRIEFEKLLRVLIVAFVGEMDDLEKIHVSDTDKSSNSILDREVFTNLLNSDPDLINAIVNTHITPKDIRAIEFRRQQLLIFQKLLNNSETSENDWQKYFEKNQWVFGYGLSYIFRASLDNRKLQQVISGFDFIKRGKRADGLMKTRGALSSICLVEIKKPSTKLLQTSAYRPETWAASDELVGGIAQSQKTTFSLTENLKGSQYLTDVHGFFTGELIHSYSPKSFLVIGSLQEFIRDNQVNSEKFASFELLRRNLINPEIITYDELYERAKYIVENDSRDEDVDETEDDDIPF